MVIMSDTNITEHHLDKNTQTDGMFNKPGAVEAKDFRREQQFEVNSAVFAVPIALNVCPARDNGLSRMSK